MEDLSRNVDKQTKYSQLPKFMKFLIRGRGQGMGVKKCTDNFIFTINILPLHTPKKLEWGNSMTIILIWIVKKYCLPEKMGGGGTAAPFHATCLISCMST